MLGRVVVVVGGVGVGVLVEGDEEGGRWVVFLRMGLGFWGVAILSVVLFWGLRWMGRLRRMGRLRWMGRQVGR